MLVSHATVVAPVEGAVDSDGWQRAFIHAERHPMARTQIASRAGSQGRPCFP